MVAVFCFCWTPYATISMAAILGHGEVNSEICRRFIDQSWICWRSIIDQSWISRRNSDWFFAEHPVVHHSTATPVCQVGDSVEPSDIPRHEPHGEYLHYQHQYQKHIWRQTHDRHQCHFVLHGHSGLAVIFKTFVVSSMVVIFIMVIIAIMIVFTINMCSVPWSFPRNPTGPTCGASSCFSAEPDGLGGYGGWCRQACSSHNSN